MIIEKLPPNQPIEYVTRRQHGTHPAGTKCQARRDDSGVLILRFDDGTETKLSTGSFLDPFEVKFADEFALAT